jgi:uncharacterized protein YrrD
MTKNVVAIGEQSRAGATRTSIPTSHVTGLPVVDIGGGVRLGQVVDVLIDPQGLRIRGFAVASGGTGLLAAEPAEASWIDGKSVRAIGPDALTVEKSDALDRSPTPAEALRVSEVLKHTVVTEGGVSVGPIASIRFDPERMTITAIEASAGFFRTNRAIPADQIVSIGPDVAVVSDVVCQPAAGDAVPMSGGDETPGTP